MFAKLRKQAVCRLTSVTGTWHAPLCDFHVPLSAQCGRALLPECSWLHAILAPMIPATPCTATVLQSVLQSSQCGRAPLSECGQYAGTHLQCYSNSGTHGSCHPMHCHRYGSRAQQERWLLPLLRGHIRSCFAMTEKQVASSDATNITASIARAPGGGYVLDGIKWWTSGAMDPRCKVSSWVQRRVRLQANAGSGCLYMLVDVCHSMPAWTSVRLLE